MKFCDFFLAVLGFELGASFLLGRCAASPCSQVVEGTHPQALFVLVVFQIGSQTTMPPA
jgi:hypothetical protein